MTSNEVHTTSRRARRAMVLIAALGASSVVAVAAHGGEGTMPLVGRTHSASTPSRTADATDLALPEPNLGDTRLASALSARRSVRTFAPRLLEVGEIAALLWAVQGVTDGEGHRTAPSAGALYPLEVYVVLPQGVFHFDPQQPTRMRRVHDADAREALWRAALAQEPVRQAPAVFVLTARSARTEQRYGPYARRFIDLEAGHAAQNILLTATALGLGAVPIGAMDDVRVRDAIHANSDEIPIYLIPVGAPR